MNLSTRWANARDQWIARRPESQHIFWLENLGLFGVVLLALAAWAVCSAFWSLYAGAIAACIGGAACAFMLSTNSWVQRRLFTSSTLLAYFAGVGFIMAGSALLLVALSLAMHSAHVSIMLAPVLCFMILVGGLVMSGIFRQDSPPDNNSGDREPPAAK